ncbi:prenyltransferase, putative [Bodo saltans]|nr:prenyltransferase, putative [Bodo saltans]|eukprot:CUG88320.1 prenyltransferase, putative [Bodo saltans]
MTMWSLIEQREAELEGVTGTPLAQSPVPTSSEPIRSKSVKSTNSTSTAVVSAQTPFTSSIQAAPKKKVSGFRSNQNTHGVHSDAAEKLLPRYFHDTKFAWNLQLVPVSLGLAFAGVFSSQTLFFYGGVLVSIAYLQGIVDHINIYDLWSTRMNYKRNVRFAIIVLVCICCSNAFWGLATEHKPEEDRTDSAGPEEGTLKKILRMNIVANQRSYDAIDFSMADRFFRPAWVQMRVLALKEQDGAAAGTTTTTDDQLASPSQEAIPPWMRREYLGQNVGSLLRVSGVMSEDRIQSIESWWYERLDHYNVFAGMML